MIITANTPFALDMDHLRFGATDVAVHRNDLVRNDHIEEGRRNILKRVERYELLAQQDTVPGFIAALYAYVWKGVLRCFQTRSEEHEGLTHHARLFWANHRYDEEILWGPAPPLETPVAYRYAGYLGSLASYFYDRPQAKAGDYANLKALLQQFWLSLSIDSRLTPRLKQEALLEVSSYNWPLILKLSKMLKALTNTAQFRLFGIGIEQTAYLPLRFLLGEVDPYLVVAAVKLLTEQGLDRYLIEGPMYRNLNYGKSAGLALAYQAMHLDAALGLIADLQGLGIHAMDDLRNHHQARCAIAQRYREMADAYEVLDLVGAFQGLTKYRKLFAEQADIWKPEDYSFKFDRRLYNGPSWLFTP